MSTADTVDSCVYCLGLLALLTHVVYAGTTCLMMSVTYINQTLIVMIRLLLGASPWRALGWTCSVVNPTPLLSGGVPEFDTTQKYRPRMWLTALEVHHSKGKLVSGYSPALTPSVVGGEA